jgi:hypothetical protein
MNSLRPPAKNALLLAFVLLALWLPRGLALDRFVTVDEPKWLMRSANFYNALARGNLKDTFQREHPGVMITWAGTAGFLWRFPGYYKIAPEQAVTPTRFHNFLSSHGRSSLDLLVAGRTFVVLGIVAALGAAFLVTTRLLGVFPALLAFLLIAFDPFSVGLSRLLHLDGLVSALMLLSVLAFAGYLYLGRRKGYLLLSAVAAGLAWLTKSPAFFLAPFFGCMLMVEGWKVGLSPALQAGDRSSRLKVGGSPPTRRSASTVASQIWQTFSPLVIWFGVAALVFVLLWPAMWVDPLGSLEDVFSLASTYASEGHDSVLFFNGIIYDVGQSPWHFYPVAYLWRVTPVVLLGLILALVALILPHRLPQSSELRRLSLVLLLFSVLFTLFLSLSAKKFDRYLLPVFAPLDIVAALGWLALLEALNRMVARWRVATRRIAGGLLLGAVLLVQMASVWQTYPYYLNYYNPLLGGPRKAVDVMMVGWGEGLDQAASYLNQKPDAEAMRVISWSADGCFSYFFKGLAAAIDYDTTIDALQRADYVVLYVNQWQRQIPYPEFLAFFEQFSPEYVIRIGGVEYARIYDMSQAPPDETARSIYTPDREVQRASD